MKKIVKENSGQSTIELLVTLTFVLGFIFSFLKLSMIYTNGYLVHYATFMASRAYLVVDSNSKRVGGFESVAQNRAKEVFKRFPLKNFISGDDINLKFNSPDPSGNKFDRNLYVGVYTDFKQKFFSPAMLGGGKEINFRSESFLGRIPTRAECVDRICEAFKLLGGNCVNHGTVSDNGC